MDDNLPGHAASDPTVNLPTRGTYPPGYILGTDFTNATKVFRKPQSLGVRTATFPLSQPSTGVTGTTKTVTTVSSSSSASTGVVFQTNSTPNVTQNILNLIQGNGILLGSMIGGGTTVTNYLSLGGVSARTTTIESITPINQGQLVTFTNGSAISCSLFNPTLAGFACFISCLGAGAVTFTPASGLINGNATLIFQTGQSAALFWDGTNWETESGLINITGSPVSGNLTVWSSPTSITSGNLSGDATTSGSTVVTLANTAVTAGTYQNTNLTVDSKGRLTAASTGSPSEVATVDLTARTAAITTTTLFAVVTAGQYRVSWDAKVTTAAGTSSTLGPLTIVYTDPDSVTQTITCGAQSNAGAIETSDAGNTTTTVLLGLPALLNCKASTNITYAFAYASNAAAAMTFNLHLRVESL